MSTQQHPRVPVLDHGYLQLVEPWGSDEGIVEAARMSTNKGFKGWGTVSGCRVHVVGAPLITTRAKRDAFSDARAARWRTAGSPGEWEDTSDRSVFEAIEEHKGDEKLLGYLYRNKHSTPFEMAGLTIEVKAPIFVFRQWHRHRTQSYNEMSSRYTPLPCEDYIPSVERLLVNSKTNKQAGTVKGSDDLTPESAELFRAQLAENYARSEQLYQWALAQGVPKELARVHLPVARYTRMRASANLRNWLAFLTLRMDAHAQYEIRVYAEAIGECIAQAFPRTWELFSEGRE